MTLFHGTDSDIDFSQVNPERGRYDVCLTDDEDVAAGYGETVHAVTLGRVALADAEQVVEIADAHGLNREGHERIEADSPYFYLLADEPAVQDAVAEEFDGIEYEDEDWNNEVHTCYRIFKPGVIRC
ncbi:MAG: hypothetical protein GVY18_05160 [Bacteroidetes bacterium]|jgi:hypothetical protein|nr:hypothetical protein [Bacteroidota bacterium]